MNTNNRFYRTIANTLVFFMIFQSVPMFELSKQYQWQPRTFIKSLTAIISYAGPSDAQAAPLANAGGPYLIDESSSGEGYWTIALDGSGSQDPDFNNLTYLWDLGTNTFSGTNISQYKWAHSLYVSQDDHIIIPGNNVWGQRYLFSNNTYGRIEGAAFQAKIMAGASGRCMIGFKNNNTTYHQNQMPYAIYFENTNIQIVENGATVQNTRIRYSIDTWYDVRIVLKESQGATYYYKPADGSSDWILLYDSNAGNDTDLKIGADVYTGTIYIDDVKEYAVGEKETCIIPGTITDISLTVRDQIGQSNTSTTTITKTHPPVANTGLYTVNEAEAGDGYWTIDLDGSASQDPESNALTYLWDLGTDTFSGTDISHYKWTYSRYVSQDDHIIIPGNNTWGQRYLFSNNTYGRIEGATFQAKIMAGASGRCRIGFKNNNTTYHQNQMPYAIYFENTNIQIVENSATVLNTRLKYSIDTWYDVRIVLKESQGATYYYKPADGSSDWILLYDSNAGNDTDLKIGADVYTGTIYIDDVKEYAVGEKETCIIPGTITDISLTVRDQIGQSNTSTTTITKTHPPVANTGLYTVNEAEAGDGYWTIDLDGSASQDPESNALTYLWDLGTNTFSGTDISHYKWAYSRYVSQDDRIIIPGNNTWGQRYLFSNNTYGRIEGATFQAKIMAGASGRCRIGFKNNNTIYHQSQMPYAIYFENTNIQIVENGATVQNTRIRYSIDTWYDVRIVLKESQGATYYYKPADGSSDWILLYDSNAGNDTDLKIGADVYTGTIYIDDVKEYAVGETVSTIMSRLDTSRIHLTVADPMDQTGSASSDVTLSTPPVSNTGGPYTFNDESLLNQGYWSVSLDASASRDTESEIKAFLWDLGTNAFNGTRLSSDKWAYSANVTQDNEISIQGSNSWGQQYFFTKNSFPRSKGIVFETKIKSGQNGRFRIGFKNNNTTYHQNQMPYAIYFENTNIQIVENGVTVQNGGYSYSIDTWYDVRIVLKEPQGAKYYYRPADGFSDWILLYDSDNESNGPFKVGVDVYTGQFILDDLKEFATGVSPDCLIAGSGPHTISLTTWDQADQMDTKSTTIEFITTPPTAEAGNDLTTEGHFPVAFDGSLSTDNAGIEKFTWNFGDGNTGNGVTTSHMFQELGDFTVTLTVEDYTIETDSDVLTVHVIQGDLPVSNAGGPYTAGVNGPPAYFNGSSSSDDYGLVKYLWDVDDTVDSDGDGNFTNDMDLVGRKPFHTYSDPGTYTATLTVVDGAGQSSTSEATVNVAENLAPDVICVPWVAGNPLSHHETYNGNSTRLKAIVRDAGALTFQWNFGDGSDPYPSTPGPVLNHNFIEAIHIYPDSPDNTPYVATLTVWDSQGLSSSDQYYVVVKPNNLDTRTNIAIDEGLWWLHKNQDQNDGHWSSHGSYYSSPTASAIQAFEINGHKQNGDNQENPYVATVRRGFEFMFTRLSSHDIDVETFGNPDTNGNGIGLEINDGQPIYQGGMIMDAIASSNTPLAIATTGEANVKGRFFYDILTDMVDMYAWGQSDNGGWRYSWNQGPDNSACQWAAIGMIAAEDNFGINVPQWVKDRNNVWLNQSYNGTGFGYASAGNSVATTPSGMVQLAFCDIPTTDYRWRTAEDYIADNWFWQNNDFYGAYALVKSLRLAQPKPVEIFTATGLDWYNDTDTGLKRRVVDRQTNSGNSWGSWNVSYGSGLSTAWAIIMLTPSLFVQPPVADAGNDIIWAYDMAVSFDASGSFHSDPSRQIVTYEWDFDGDGTWDFATENPSDPNAAFTFPDPNPGVDGDAVQIYTARLRVTDNNTPAQTDIDTREITIAEPPHAPFAAHGGPYTAKTGIPVVLNGSGSYDIDPGDSITRYQWDLDDDGRWFDDVDLDTETANDTYIFSTPGVYNIALRVFDNGAFNPVGCSVGVNCTPLTSDPVFTLVTVVANSSPESSAGGPYTVDEGTSLNLDGSGSTDPDGNVLSFSWDLDNDGDYGDSTRVQPEYTWADDGTYTIGLKVSDSNLSDTDSTTVTVNDLSPVADFIFSPATQVEGSPVNFKDASSSSPDTLTNWQWDFGGIETSQLQHPTVTFNTNGTHAVSLMVTDDDGSTHTISKQIVIRDNTPTASLSGDSLVGIDTQANFDAGGSSSSPDAISRYEWDWNYNGTTFNPSGKTGVTQHHAWSDPGIYVVAVRVWDDDGSSSTASLAVTVRQTGPTANAGIDQTLFKNLQNTRNNVTLDGSESINPDGGILAFKWFGPFGVVTGESPEVAIPEGTYTVSMKAENEAEETSVDTVEITVSPCFLISARSKRGKTQISWSHVEGTDVYHVFRADASDPFNFNKIAETTSTYSTYLDLSVVNETTYLYVVGALSQGTWCYSSVTSSHPSAIRGRHNYAPVIYSQPIETATAGYIFNYDVNGTDPNNDALTYHLTSDIDGMTMDAATGLITWIPNMAGSLDVTVEITDGNGMTDSQSLTIDVIEETALNLPPEITSDPIETGRQNDLYTYTVTASDPENDPLTFHLDVFPTGMTIDTDSGIIEWTPGQVHIGNHSVTVRVSDEPGLSAIQTFTITVENVNDRPVVTALLNQSMAEGDSIILPISVIDQDGDDLVLAINGLPPFGAFSDNGDGTGTLSFNPGFSDSGQYEMTVTATDQDLTGVYTFILTVDNTNRAPVISSDPTVNAFEDTAYTYAVMATDPDGDTLFFYLDTPPAGMTIDAQSGVINWTPASINIGTHDIRVRAQDSGGLTALQTYTLNVSPTNDHPVLTKINDQVVNENETLTIPISAADPDNTVLSISVTGLPSFAGFTDHLDRTGTISVNPGYSHAGEYPIIVTVSDGTLTDAISFTLTVNNVNQPPQITSTPTMSVNEEVQYLYNVEATDPDTNDILTFSLTVFPAGMAIEPATGIIQWTPTFSQSGNHIITITVTDVGGLSDSQTYTIDVNNVNRTPVINPIANQVMAEDGHLIVTVSAFDPDGDLIELSANNLPAFGILTDNGNGTGDINFTSGFSDSGLYPITITASDNSLSQSTTFTLTVNPVNRQPVVTSSPITSGSQNALYSYDVDAEDPDDDDLTYSLITSPAGMDIDETTGLIGWMPAENVPDGVHLENGLVAYYPFNGNANDESGNGNDGIVYGATLTLDRYGNSSSAYEFDGLNDYISIDDSASLDISGNITLSYWFKLDGLSQDYYHFIGKSDDGANAFMNYDTYVNTIDNKLTFTLGDGTESVSVQTRNPIEIEKWYNVVFLFEDGYLRVYVNGQFDNEIVHNITPIQNNMPLQIGAWSKNQVGPRYFDGIIDDISIHNRALTEEEIQYLTGNHNVTVRVEDGKGGSDEQGFNVQVMFDQGSIPTNTPPEITSIPEIKTLCDPPGDAFEELQAIPTVGAWDWESFKINGETYIAVANYKNTFDGEDNFIAENGKTYNQDSKIYKWNGSSFVEIQSIPTNGGHGWESFVIDGETYLVIANCFNDTSFNINSKIYKWNGSLFEEFQSIPTIGASDWKSFTIAGETYLAVANLYDGSSYYVTSVIYKWNGSSFEVFQTIPTIGAYDWESFEIDGVAYLAIANSRNGTFSYNNDSKIYKWNGSSFVEYQTIPTKGARDWEHFKIEDETYLAVANPFDGTTRYNDSIIYKWDGNAFTEYQSVPTVGGQKWQYIVINNIHYLAIANAFNGNIWNINSQLYKWDGSNFIEFQSIPTNCAHSWSNFSINGENYLALSNANNDVSYNIDSKIYKWNGTCFDTAVSTEGSLYGYDIEATDPDGDDLTFSLVSGPDDLTIDPVTGQVLWTPSSDQIGRFTIEVEVSDGNGGTDNQTYTITVDEVNYPPIITSDPPATVIEGKTFYYDVEAVDPNNDLLEFSLDNAPQGMTINVDSGLIEWNPQPLFDGEKVQFLDGSFLAEDWVALNVFTYDNGGSVVMSQETSSGNPDSYASFDIHVNGASDANSQSDVYVFMANKDSIYTPQSDSGILYVDGSFDVISGGSAFGSYLGLIQDGIVYLKNIGSTTENQWVNRSADYLFADDFAAFRPDVSEFPLHPDFSPGASPIQFGLIIGNNISPGSGAVSYRAGIDNWKIVVTPSASDSVELSVTDKKGGFDSQNFSIHSILGSFIRGHAFMDSNNDKKWDREPDIVTIGSGHFHRFLKNGTLYNTVNDVGGGYSLTIGPDGAFYYSAGGYPGIVRRLDEETGEVTDFVVSEHLNLPWGLEFGPNGDLYVSSYISDTVERFDGLTGEHIASIGAGHLNVPNDVVFDSNGRLYVLSAHTTSIEMFDMETGVYQGRFARHDYLRNQGGMEFGPDGNLYVSQWYPQNVVRFNGSTGAYLGEFVPSRSGGLERAGEIAFGPDGHLYVCSIESGQVLKYDGTTGAFLGAAVTMPKSASVIGIKFHKPSNNPPEPSLESWQVYLDTNMNERLDSWEESLQTGEDGGYFFSSIAPGEHVVRVAIDTGYELLSPAAGLHETTLQQGETAYTLNFGMVSDSGFNRAPLFTSTPLTETNAGTEYLYDVNAVDPEGQPLTYTLISKPVGMGIDPQSGQIVWFPDVDDIGEHDVMVQVDDGNGGTDTQAFVITVSSPGNTPPEITSSAITTMLNGADYSYQIIASDIDGDELVYELMSAPDFMEMSPEGLISWAYTPNRPTQSQVSVLVSDGNGGTAEQEWTIALLEIAPPVVTLLMSTNMPKAGDSPVDMQVQVQSSAAILSTELKIEDQIIPLDPSGIAHVAVPAVGFYTVMASAVDEYGQTGSKERLLMVGDPNDTTYPAITLDNDENECIEITDLYPITGTIDEEESYIYELQYYSQSCDKWVTMTSNEATGTHTGVLGVFDPTLLKNGAYDYRIHVYDTSGNVSNISGCVIVDGQLKIGQVNFAQQDLSLPAMGFPLTVTREYDSRAECGGDFGPGWNLPSKNVSVTSTTVLGEEWTETETGGMFTSYCVAPTRDHTVVIRLSDTDVYKFEMITRIHGTDNQCQVFVHITSVDVSFVPVDGTTGTLEALDFSGDMLLQGTHITDYDLNIYDPQRFRLTTRDGTTYVISAASGIESITDQYGHTISYSNDGIVHSSGAGISFERGEGNRIDKVIDPLGRTIEYLYDENGYLEEVVQTGQSSLERVLSSYSYLTTQSVEAIANFEGKTVLKDMVAPDGTIVGQYEYDSHGRFIGFLDADGNKISYDSNAGDHSQTITDRLGNQTQYIYDDRGNVTMKIDPLGNRTEWTYDSHGNMLTETDPYINTTTYTYNVNGDMLTRTDPLGNTTSYTYNLRGDILTETDPLGNVISKEYDTNGKLLRVTDPLGNVTINTYNADGYLEKVTDPLGNAISYGYDSNGNLIKTIDALGNDTSYTYDEYGNKLTVTDSSGIITSFTYNADNKVETEIGPRGGVKTYTYDTVGNMTSSTNSLGHTISHTFNTQGKIVTTTDAKNHVSSFTYDAEGNKLTEEDVVGNIVSYVYDSIGKLTKKIDKNGNITEMEYDDISNLIGNTNADGTTENRIIDATGNILTKFDPTGQKVDMVYNAIGKIIEVHFVDGGIISNEYNANGKVTAKIDALGNRTEYEYDAVGNNILVRDALGNETHFEYDANKNRTAIIDALGHSIEYEYNSYNKITKITYHDGTTKYYTYDSMGLQTSETDQDGNTTTFVYDLVGNLISVTDSLTNSTIYTYDENNNRLTQTDTNGNTTFFAWNNLDQLASKTYSNGDQETYTYDSNGNMISMTSSDSEITTYEYDPLNREIKRTYASGNTVEKTYFVETRLNSAVDQHGVQTFEYDERGRLSKVTHPNGETIEYGYDLNGNRTTLTTLYGTTIYTYDALNRMETITSPDNDVTKYTYDAIGRRTSLIHNNGIVVEYDYDNLNRISNITTKASNGSVISSYTYTLNNTGIRTSVTETDGSIVNYMYDDLYRLIAEVRTGTNAYSIEYTYDNVGNRLTKNHDGIVTEYFYNNRDQLLAEISGSETVTNIYGNTGRIISKTDRFGTTFYNWIDNDRLDSISGPGVSITYEYDYDGKRISENSNGIIKNFLIDTQLPYGQVIAETDEANQLTAEYVYGLERISQNREGNLSVYLADAQGSIRRLADDTETITDTYDYYAFGELLSSKGNTENNFFYVGDQWDANSGYYYLRARWYNPEDGRFMSVDSYPGDPQSPVSLHRYLYANASPLNFVDHSGNFSLLELQMAEGIQASLAINIAVIGMNGINSLRHKDSNDPLSTNNFLLTSLAGIDGGMGLYGGILNIGIAQRDMMKYSSIYSLIFLGVGTPGISVDLYAPDFWDIDNWDTINRPLTNLPLDKGIPFQTIFSKRSSDFKGFGAVNWVGGNIYFAAMGWSLYILPPENTIVHDKLFPSVAYGANSGGLGGFTGMAYYHLKSDQ